MKISMSFPRATAIAAAAALAGMAAVTVAPATAASKRSSAGLSCSSTLKIGFVTPLTGVAAYLGQEQLTWAKYAVATLPAKYGLKFKLVPGVTPVEQGPAPALTLAQKYVAVKSVVGIIGPSTSSAVAASSKTYNQAGIVQISPSATRTTLTKGDNQEATKSFFRVVPADDLQGPTDAGYMTDTLKVKNVVVIDFQEPYSQGLGGEVENALQKAGVTTSHQSIANTVTDYSAYVTKVPSAADIVFFPTQSPAAAQAFAGQLVEQGKKAKVFVGDGGFGPGAFKAPGSFASIFAPDVTTVASSKSIVDGWKKANPGKTAGSFGPPTYGAVQVMLTAIKAACTAGKGTIAQRSAVVAATRKVTIDQGWILGGKFRWSTTNTRDPSVTKFYLYEIQSDGSYKRVG